MSLGALALALALLAGPVSAQAQQADKVTRLGVLLFGAVAGDPNLAAFQEGLRELGYNDGRNLRVEYRAAQGDVGRLGDLAADMVRSSPDVIVAFGGDVAPFATRATRTIPIVMLTSDDPVRTGLVASLARPGANVTGVTLLSADLAAKRLQLLKEAIPRITRVGVLRNPEHQDYELPELQGAAQTLGVQILPLEVRGAADFEGAFVTGWGPWAEGGALLSYGPNLNLVARRAATYVDRIVKGAKPGDLPVEQPTKVELVVNVKAARALGLSLAPSLLQRADRVIE